MDTLPELFAHWQQQWLTPAMAWQLAVILLSASFAMWLHRRWQGFLTQWLGEQEQSGLRRIALRGSGRIIFPVAMLLPVMAASSVLETYAIHTPLLNLLVPLLGSLALIRAVAYMLRRAYSPSPALRAWEGMISTLVWLLVALHLLGWLPGILQALDGPSLALGEARLSLLSMIKFVLAAAVFIVLARWLSQAIEQRARRSQLFSASMQVGLAKSSKFILYTVAVLIALNSVGIDLTTLAVFGGALGVGLGFGLQRIASNFISGFILLFDRSIKPGDVISIGTRFGWVVALHARYVVVRDRDGVEALIPNENLITSEVTNWSYSDRHVRVKLPVQISYRDDPEQAMQLMLDACEANPRVLQDPAPQVRLLAFGDNGINLELRLWLDDPEEGIGNVKSDVNLAIWKAFKANGITIPFPQRDVRVLERVN